MPGHTKEVNGKRPENREDDFQKASCRSGLQRREPGTHYKQSQQKRAEIVCEHM